VLNRLKSAWRQSIAVLAVYAVVLQMVVLGVVVGSQADPAWSVVCSHSSVQALDLTGRSSDQSNQDICCTAGCLMTASPLARGENSTVTRHSLLVFERLRPTLGRTSRTRMASGPHSPRAPPA